MYRMLYLKALIMFNKGRCHVYYTKKKLDRRVLYQLCKLSVYNIDIDIHSLNIFQKIKMHVIS